LKELERRNDVLDSELGQACPEMRIRRPSPSHMISVLELPRAIHAGELTVFLYDQHPHVLTGSFENYDPEQRVRTSHRHLLRVSTGNMDLDGIRQGTKLLAERIRDYQP